MASRFYLYLAPESLVTRRADRNLHVEFEIHLAF